MAVEDGSEIFHLMCAASDSARLLRRHFNIINMMLNSNQKPEISWNEFMSITATMAEAGITEETHKDMMEVFYECWPFSWFKP